MAGGGGRRTDPRGTARRPRAPAWLRAPESRGPRARWDARQARRTRGRVPARGGPGGTHRRLGSALAPRAHTPPGGPRAALEPDRARDPGRAPRRRLPNPFGLWAPRPPRGLRAPGAQRARRPDPVAGGPALPRECVDPGAGHDPSRRSAPGASRSHGAHWPPYAPPGPDTRGVGVPGRAPRRLTCTPGGELPTARPPAGRRGRPGRDVRGPPG